jgi:multidrug efflux pump
LDWVFGVLLGWYFWLFNKAFALLTEVYSWLVAMLLRWSWPALALYAAMLAATGYLITHWPTGFIPQQDQGRLIVNVVLPDAASLERTREVMLKIERIVKQFPGVAHTVSMVGNSFIAQSTSSNFGTMFIILAPFEERRDPQLYADVIMRNIRRKLREEVNEALVALFGAAPVPGIGLAGGFKLMVEDRGALGLVALQEQSDRMIKTLNSTPGMAGVMTQYTANSAQLYMDIDRTKIMAMGVSIADVNEALNIYLGSLYVNSFNAFGRFWQVDLMAEGDFRNRNDVIRLMQVRNNQGQMVPLSTLVTLRDYSGPVMVNRYNLYPAAPLNGNVVGSKSTGEAFREIEEIGQKTLPRTMATEWTDLAYFQKKAGDTTLAVFALAVVFVFLALAALYESWSLPLAVILVVPLCILSSIAGLAIAVMSLNLFVQIGLVVLVGLACKNAILIVEFARALRGQGKPIVEATHEASRLRLRPITMTSLAFILGVVPLVVARGAGAEMRQALGTAVLSGMIGVTLFGLLLTPVFFKVIQGFTEQPTFAGPTFQWVGSLATGLALGLVVGYLLHEIGFPSLRWALVLGGSVGIFVALAVRRVYDPKRRRQPPPAQN